MSPQSRSDVLRGTLDLLILQTLALEPMHGWGVAQRIHQISSDALPPRGIAWSLLFATHTLVLTGLVSIDL